MNDRHAAANLEQIRLLLEGLQLPRAPAPGAAPQEAAEPSGRQEETSTGPGGAGGDATGAGTDQEEAAG